MLIKGESVELSGSTNFCSFLVCVAGLGSLVLLTNEEFDSSCTLLASSAFEPTMTEDTITSMNTECAPQGEMDVLKAFREQADLKDPVQNQRFSRLRDKVTDSLIKSVRSSSRS